MASEVEDPKRESTPTNTLSSIPQKRAFEEDHSPHVPAVPSPLNPDVRPSPKVQIQIQEEMPPATRDKPARTKKESLKKRESKGDSSRATPDPKAKEVPPPSESSPLRYKLAPPKPSDFDPPRGPVFTPHHEVPTLTGGGVIEFHETSEQ
jgi:COMPASS component BRE2